MTMSKDRLEAFSDGIFAVALTLLVLDLRVPEIQSGSSLAQYGAAMAPLVPKMVSFVLSFALIANQWVSHHYFFRQLSRTPLAVVWLNNLFLLWICLMPFPTALLGAHPTDQFPILLYIADSLLAALTMVSIRAFVSRHKLIDGDAATAQAMGPRHSLPALALFMLAIPLAFVNAYLSLACLVIVPLLYFVPSMVERLAGKSKTPAPAASARSRK